MFLLALLDCLKAKLHSALGAVIRSANAIKKGEWSFCIAYVNGKTPAGAAVMYMNKGTASLTFAAVLPEYRGRGIHQALIRRRLDQASRSGCTLAVGQAAYVSASARNMERSGMKLGYTRATWTSM